LGLELRQRDPVTSHFYSLGRSLAQGRRPVRGTRIQKSAGYLRGELPYRPPLAFVAGVLGPLVGADLLHLRHITQVPVGVLSIGGAGTFDRIVLSSFMATLMV
jgi:Protein of unknown function (DUF1614)